MTSAERFPSDVLPMSERARRLTPAQRAAGNELLFRYGGDLRFFFVVGSVATMQLMHPSFTSVVADNSVFYADVWRRWFDRTQPMLQRAVFDENPVPVAHQIRDIHTNLEGVDAKGRTWHALNPKVFHWAHATQYYGVWQVMERLDGRVLNHVEREAYYQATRRVWSQFGLDLSVSPPDWPSFVEYYENFVENDLEAISGPYEMLEFLTRQVPPPPVPGIPKRLWNTVSAPVFEQYGRMTVGFMHPKARDILGLRWTEDDERWLRTVGRNVARVVQSTPHGWWISPEARAARFRHDTSLRGRYHYLAGEVLQRPIQTAWRLTTR